MYELYSKIGDHYVNMKTESLHAQHWLRESFSASATHRWPEAASTDLDIEIVWGYGEPFAGFHVDVEKDESRVIYTRADYRIEVDQNYRQAHMSVHDEYALKHALLNLYSAFITYRGWGLVIHSSCVIENSLAYIFSGQSGAGKSTVARLSQPRPLLSDEASLVRIMGDQVTVFDSPFRSDTTPKLVDGGYPLAAIHLLKQASFVQRSLLKPSDGMLRLLDKAFYWAHDGEETKKVLRMYTQLVKMVPIYDLYFPKNDTFWEAIS